MNIGMKAVGYIKSPYKNKEDIPKQSVVKSNVLGEIQLLEEYREGIFGYREGDNIVILFNFHKSKETPMIIDHHSGERKGVFNTRAPNRPNPIGLTISKIVAIDYEKGRIEFEGVDMLDKTPVLDIKPYSEELNPKK